MLAEGGLELLGFDNISVGKAVFPERVGKQGRLRSEMFLMGAARPVDLTQDFLLWCACKSCIGGGMYPEGDQRILLERRKIVPVQVQRRFSICQIGGIKDGEGNILCQQKRYGAVKDGSVSALKGNGDTARRQFFACLNCFYDLAKRQDMIGRA